MAVPAILLLGAHRWRRQQVVQFAQSAGLNPLVLLYEGEPLPPRFAQTLRDDQVIPLSNATPVSARQIADSLTRLGQEWFVLGLDDYVCELAAAISQHATKKTMQPLGAEETLRKHMLRARWNSLCKNDPALFPVPFRVLLYSDAHFTDVVEKWDDPAFSESVPLIIKPDALDASIGIQQVVSWSRVDQAIANIRQQIKPLIPAVIPMGINIFPAILAENRIPRSNQVHRSAEFSAEFISIGTHVGSGNSEPLIPEILTRSGFEGKASSKFR